MAKKTTKKTAKKASKKTSRRTTSGRGPARYRILSLDGGGIRGVMTASWLAQLEKRLGGPVADHVDLIAGTSTGSILACALCKRIPASEIIDLYRTRGRDIFPATAERLWNRLGRTFTEGPSAPKYDDDGLEQSLRECLGETTMREVADGPKLMVTTYNTITRQAVVLKSWREEFAYVPLWEAAKASSSAPTYFPAHVTGVLGATTPLIDGGVVANNPTACAIAEAVKLHGDDLPLSRIVVGSFGTGESTRPISVRQSREWGAAEWAVPVISVIMDGAADATDYIARQLLAPEKYVRVDTKLSRAFDDMDDASATNIEALLNVAKHHLDNEGGRGRLDQLKTLYLGSGS